ncbi:uncharacterized protein AB675_7403 [Cyphellophora attinorum]|uniref:Uncharacterized protein n=1 Tax=Cyphellophora attinorum TaxID=1664694 RepID=A0A0N0NHD1_9EURO|nr:uncharacterized protein AB675_7403 [Phialophora attinorum]KPI34551.1 hypothetical protein AB675_7403 [Phialophora attinorum]
MAAVQLPSFEKVNMLGTFQQSRHHAAATTYVDRREQHLDGVRALSPYVYHRAYAMDSPASRPPQDLTFVSMTGPTLNESSAKAMRAHTTRANFRKRRHRLVQEYLDQKAKSAPPGTGMATPTTPDTRPPQVLSGIMLKDDASLINYLTHEMEKLYPATGRVGGDQSSSRMHSHWVSLLSDPAMRNVSLYFATQVYMERLRLHTEQFLVSAAKGTALQSLGDRLNGFSGECPDSLIAAILTLTVLDQVLGNISGWQIHLSGLIQIVAARSQDATQSATVSWTDDVIARAVMQGLLLFDRHDPSLMPWVESTGVFDTCFSAPGKEAAYLILLVARRLNAAQSGCVRTGTHFTADIPQPESMMEALNEAIDLSRKGYSREAYLTALALSMKLSLAAMLPTDPAADDSTVTAVSQLLDAVQAYEVDCPFAGLILCSSLGLRLWQSIMGAISASEPTTKQTFVRRLGPICDAMGIQSWEDATSVLQKLFWVPSILDAAGHRVYLEVRQASSGSGT